MRINPGMDADVFAQFIEQLDRYVRERLVPAEAEVIATILPPTVRNFHSGQVCQTFVIRRPTLMALREQLGGEPLVLLRRRAARPGAVPLHELRGSRDPGHPLAELLAPEPLCGPGGGAVRAALPSAER